jgi:hypothetical protein
MKYQDAMYAMVKEILTLETEQDYKDYYLYLLSRVRAGKKTTAVPIGLAQISPEKFVDIFQCHNLHNPIPQEGNIKQVNGKYSVYGKDGWYTFLTTSP